MENGELDVCPYVHKITMLRVCSDFSVYDLVVAR